MNAFIGTDAVGSCDDQQDAKSTADDQNPDAGNEEHLEGCLQAFKEHVPVFDDIGKQALKQTHAFTPSTLTPLFSR